MPFPAFLKPSPRNKDKAKESASKVTKKGSAATLLEKNKILDSTIDPNVQVKLPPPIRTPTPIKQDTPSSGELELPLIQQKSSDTQEISASLTPRRKSLAPAPPAPAPHESAEGGPTLPSEKPKDESGISDSEDPASTLTGPALSKMMTVADVIQDNFIEIREAIAVLHDYVDPDRTIESDASASEGVFDTDADSQHSKGSRAVRKFGLTQSERADTSVSQSSGQGYEQGLTKGASSTSTATHEPNSNLNPTTPQQQSADPDEFIGAGCYKFDSAQNVDEYLRALGVGLVFRKVQSAANPVMTIYPSTSHEWAIKMDSIFRTREVKFEIGKEFVDETFDGRPCKSLALIDQAQNLVIHQHCNQGPDVKVLYQLKHNSHMEVTLDSGPHRAILNFTVNPS